MTATTFIAALAAVAALGTAGAASATEFESNGKTFEVHYGDLDLSQKAGQRALNARVKRAAAKVCPADASATAVKKCQIAAIAHVRASMDSAIARAETGDRLAGMSKEKAVGAAN